MGIYSLESFIESIKKKQEDKDEKIVFEIGLEDQNISESGKVKPSDDYSKISKYTLWIRNNEGSNMPHFHVNKGSEIMCYICLDIPIYFDHGDGVSKPLKSKEADQLYDFLSNKYDPKSGLTIYQTLCNLWEDSNGSFTFPDDVPDYSKLDPFITSKTIDVDEYRRSGKIIYKK